MTLRLSCFFHMPSIYKGVEALFTSPRTSIDPLKAGIWFRHRIALHHRDDVSLDNLFIYSDLYNADRKKTRNHRKTAHATYLRDAREQGVHCEIRTGLKPKGKGLEVKMALDFADLAWDSASDETLRNPIDKYIAVMFAMDREIAPGVERIIEHYGGRGIKVWVAMWSSSRDDRRDILSKDKDISLEMYQRIFLGETALLDMRDDRNYSRSHNSVRTQKSEQRNVQRQSTAQAWQRLSEEEKEFVHQAQKAITDTKSNEGGWVSPSRLGETFRKQFPNHPAVKIKKALTKWFERESMEHFFEVKRINQHEIFIRVRR